MFGSSNLRLLIGLALQIGLTLENYAVMHDAQRRTKEFALLTQIGQAISSRLDQDEILRTVQKELGQIFDTSEFYIAFQEGDEIRFELEVEKGEVLPKRTRKLTNGLTEYIIRSGQPLLIRSELEKIAGAPGRHLCAAAAGQVFLRRAHPAGRPAGRSDGGDEHGARIRLRAARPGSHANCGGAGFRGGRKCPPLRRGAAALAPAGFPEQHFEDRDFERRFRADAGRHRRPHPEEFQLRPHRHRHSRLQHQGDRNQGRGRDHGAGAGQAHPAGPAGILGRVARTGEAALVQTTSEAQLQGVLPGSRSVLCIPIAYGENFLGVLNVESHKEDAFTPADRLIMNTLADLLATALHNAFVFQKLQQQSITDGLTLIKTRRFFFEALSSELKRASRSGRPISVVLMDLDKFKSVNDTKGHLEGDLVLTRVGRLLEQKCRQSNVVARYGGDEFIILMPETGVEQAQILAERLRLWISQDPMLAEHHITGSFGVASFPVHGFSMEDIVRVADAGMYVSKRAGGDRVSDRRRSCPGGESAAVRRQLISGYIEGFLQREHTGPEHVEELITTLKKMCGDEAHTDQILREAIETLTSAAESRELNSAGHGEMVARYSEIIARSLGMRCGGNCRPGLCRPGA